uniref:uncharacterized protein LOC114600493 n=1 Tax=Podarcis muralis TaxID=64176 RepID=UPI00109F3607|nr:uncharacterized protein LOC114600493 [Podarcis muralis]
MAPKKVAARPGPASGAKRPIRGPSQALRSPAPRQPAGRVQTLVESMAGNPAALSRFAAQMDGLLQHCSAQPSTSGRRPRHVVSSSPASPSSSEDGRDGSSKGLRTDSQLAQPRDSPVPRGRSRRPRSSSGRAARSQNVVAASARRGVHIQSSDEVASGSGLSLVVSPQAAPGAAQLSPDSEASVEDSLPVPARRSSGGKRRRRRSSRKRSKRRRAESSSSYTGLAAVRIWLVGHSIIHWARVAARQSGLGPGLGFPPHVQLSWVTRRGMRWSEFLPRIRSQLLLEGPPSAIVVQLGENDLVSVDCLSLRAAILRDLETLRTLVPSAKLFWSKLLQRRSWVGSFCPAATERARKRINSAVVKKIFELDGDVISHPAILFQATPLFRDDGVHLSAAGNEAWLGAVVAKLRAWLGV